MKTKLFPALAGLCGLGFALLLAPSLVKPAQAETKRRHDFVVLQASEYYNVTPNPNPGNTYLYQFAGFYVYNYDGSAGAPKMTLPVSDYAYTVTTNQLAQTLANLADDGFDMTWTDGRTYVLRK